MYEHFKYDIDSAIYPSASFLLVLMQWALKNAIDLLSHRLEWIAFNITSNNRSLFQMAISLHCMKSQLTFDKTFSMAYVAQTVHKVSN